MKRGMFRSVKFVFLAIIGFIPIISGILVVMLLYRTFKYRSGR